MSRKPYVLDAQIGFILRQVLQRHVTIFDQRVGKDLTPTQWAALVKLAEVGECSQNHLGRLTAIDVATIKGVIDRLSMRGLTGTTRDPADGRRLLVNLTRAGGAVPSVPYAPLAQERPPLPLMWGPFGVCSASL
jgi:hypothetical protein